MNGRVVSKQHCSHFGFLGGTIPKPAEGSPDLEDWLTINALLVSWMKMTIDPELLTNISHRQEICGNILERGSLFLMGHQGTKI